MWRHRGFQREAGERHEGLVFECERFLHGQLAEDLIREGTNVPDWAWINLMAHGTGRQLKKLASKQIGGSRLVEKGWSQAASRTAGWMLAAAEDSGIALEELQHRVIIPIELDPGMTNQKNPAEFEDRVLGGLDQYLAR